MIFNLRGPTASGKSSLMKALMAELGPAEPIVSQKLRPGKIVGYELPGKVFIAGRYPEGLGGGIDNTFNTKGAFDMCYELVAKLSKRGHVFFESILVSTVYGRWARMADEHPFTWLFLDTPLDVCIERVHIRNKGKTISLDRLRHHYKCNESCHRKAVEAGYNVRAIHWETPLQDILAALKEVS